MERLKTIKRVFPKLLAFNSKPTATTFPELLDATIWIRFFIAVVYGVNMGYIRGYQGGVGVLFGANLITFVPFIYLSNYLRADLESYNSLIFAGVGQSLALFLLVWIYFFTKANEGDELKLAMALLSGGGGDAGGVEGVVDGQEEEMVASEPGQPQSEF
jgi:hypothetical protein